VPLVSAPVVVNGGPHADRVAVVLAAPNHAARPRLGVHVVVIAVVSVPAGVEGAVDLADFPSIVVLGQIQSTLPQTNSGQRGQ